MPTIFAETDRLLLRGLEKSELPRLVELLGVWDVIKWLVVLPYPYTLRHAKEFYADMEVAAICGEPQFYAISSKSDGLLVGGIGLHPPRGVSSVKGEMEIGYWLGREYWGQGFMTESAGAAVSLSFARPTTDALVATTAINNVSSQNVLRKLGLHNVGTAQRDYPALRGDEEVIRWRMARTEWHF